MEKLLFITTKQELKQVLLEVLNEKYPETTAPKLEDDRLTRTQAADFIGISLPNFRRRIAQGIFKEHGHGQKKFFLRSEIIDALKNEADKSYG